MHARLTIDGRAIETAWWGPPAASRPTLVLLHEGLGSVSRWRDVPLAIAERTGWRVMAYSRFGHGQSDAPPTPHTIRFMHEEARLLPRILDAAGLDRAVLLGHSDGASIGLMAAAQCPARIQGLILEAPHVFVEDVAIASIDLMRRRFVETDLRARLGRHHVDPELTFRGWCDVWLDPAFLTWNLESFLPQVRCPVLLIQGEQDPYGTLRQVDAIARQVSGPVERLVLAECGHAPHRDQRERFLDAVAGFLTQWP